MMPGIGLSFNYCLASRYRSLMYDQFSQKRLLLHEEAVRTNERVRHPDASMPLLCHS